MSERLTGDNKVQRLTRDEFVNYLVRHGLNFSPELLAVQLSTADPEEQKILINTSVVPSDLEKYFIVHEVSHIVTETKRERVIGVREILGLSGPQYTDPDTGNACFAQADQVRAIYDEYVSAYDGQQLDELYLWMESYTASILQSNPQDCALKLQLKTDIAARKGIKASIEQGIRIEES